MKIVVWIDLCHRELIQFIHVTTQNKTLTRFPADTVQMTGRLYTAQWNGTCTWTLYGWSSTPQRSSWILQNIGIVLQRKGDAKSYISMQLIELHIAAPNDNFVHLRLQKRLSKKFDLSFTESSCSVVPYFAFVHFRPPSSHQKQYDDDIATGA